MTPDTSGREWLTPSASYDPEASCWRTSGAIFPSDWPTSSETCPPWGMTRAGDLYELPTPELPTVEPACSSSLLPTPNASVSQDGEGFETWEARRQVALTKGYNGNGIGMPLTIAVQLLPTPTTDPASHNGHARNLRSEVPSLLPTPTTSDTNGSGGHGTGGPDLRTAVSLLPTPKATADRTSRGAPALGQAVELAQGILPREFRSWEEVPGWHGAPTSPPSDGGSESWGDQPLDLLSGAEWGSD